MTSHHHANPTRRKSHRIAITLLCLGVACSSADAPEPDAGTSREITAEALLALNESPESVLILDVRSPSEFDAGHVPGAVNIAHDQIVSRIGEIDTSRENGIVVYCESGRRAGLAIDALTDAGVEGVRHLDGDMKGWRDAGRPVER